MTWRGMLTCLLTAEPRPLGVFERQASYPWMIVALVSIGAFIGQLDATIVQLALPTLGKTFSATLEAVSWVSLAYLVAFASFLPIFGRLCEIYGRKSLYIIGYVIFIAATLMCGFAPDLDWLIACRVMQGIGGSMLGANSIAILVAAIDQQRRGRALGYFAAAQAVGMCAGPAVGGLALGWLGWQWVFWVSVPFGLAGAALGWLILPQTKALETRKRFDQYGALLLGPAIVMVVLALNQVTAWGATSPFIVGLILAAAILIWLLIREERNSSSPLVDLRLFANGAFTRGIIAVILGYALLYGMFFLMSFALEHGYSDTPQAAGLRLAVIPIALGLVAPLSGTLSDKIGERLLSAGGMALCLVALAILAFAEADPDLPRPISTAAFVIFGAGLGIFIAPNNHATLAAAPGNLSGEAGSILNLMRALGTSFGVAAASATLSWRLESATGLHQTWIPFPGHPTLRAIEGSLLLLALMAIAAAALSLWRSKR